MPVPIERFVQQLEDSGILASETLKDFLPPQRQPKDAEELARELVRQKKLSRFQAEEIYRGNGKSLVLGNYTVLDKIGAGGMGQVFKAEHRRMHRIVAIKILPSGMMKDAAMVARFEREVTAAARLNHPNIVTAFDADNANGVHLLVMEYVEGSDLAAIVKKNGPLPVENALHYILQAATGLDAAHAEGIVHRDIKPANLLLDIHGTVKILDMGLARLGDQAGQAELTTTGIVMGTVDFMAPEQALNTKGADARADIYSLGCSLFHLLTGKATYDGDTLMAKLLAHRDQPIPSIRGLRPDVPESVDSVFRRMVAKHVDDRYQTMVEVIADLQACLSGRKPSIEPLASVGSLFGSSIDEGLTNFLRETSISPSDRVVALKPASATANYRKQILIGGSALTTLFLAGVVFSFRFKDGKPAVDVRDPDGKKSIAAKLEQIDGRPRDSSQAVPPPLSDTALVTSPVRLRGVRSWTISPAANRASSLLGNGSLALSPAAPWFAVSNDDGGTRIFDIATGKLLKILAAPGKTNLVAWSHDGKLLATAGQDNRVLLWNYASARRIGSIEAQATYLAWSPAGTVLAVATGQDVQFFDEHADRCRPTLPVASATVLSWAPDGDRLAVATYAGMIDVRRTTTGEKVAAWSAYGKPGMINIAWSRSKDSLASAISEEPVRIWNPLSGKLLRTLADTSSSAGNHHALAWSPDRDELTVAMMRSGESERIAVQTYVGDAESQSRRFDVYSLGALRNIGLSRDSRRLVVLIGQGLVYVHDTSQPKKSYTAGHTQGLSGAALTEQGNAIAFTSKKATNSTWGALRVMTLALDRDWKTGFRDLLQEYAFATQLTFTSSGPDPVLAVMERFPEKNPLEMWRGLEIVGKTELPQAGTCLAASLDGRRLAIGLDKAVAIVDAEDLKVVENLPAQTAQVFALAWGPNGRLAAGYADGAVRIWSSDFSEFATATPYGSNSSPIKRIAWSPDGLKIGAIQLRGRDVALIDATDGRTTETIFAGEEPGNIVWLDDAMIVARTPTCLKRWPIADVFAYEKICEAPCEQGLAEFASGGRFVAERISSSDYRFRDGRTGRVLGTLVMVQDCRPVVISPEGHYSAPVDVDDDLVYVVETDDGKQQTLTPGQFASRFKWKNDPSRAFPLRLDHVTPDSNSRDGK